MFTRAAVGGEGLVNWIEWNVSFYSFLNKNMLSFKSSILYSKDFSFHVP